MTVPRRSAPSPRPGASHCFGRPSAAILSVLVDAVTLRSFRETRTTRHHANWMIVQGASPESHEACDDGSSTGFGDSGHGIEAFTHQHRGPSPSRRSAKRRYEDRCGRRRVRGGARRRRAGGHDRSGHHGRRDPRRGAPRSGDPDVQRQLLGDAQCALAVAPRGFSESPEPRLALIGVGYDGTAEPARRWDRRTRWRSLPARDREVG